MTNQQMRIAIAEACGWRFERMPHNLYTAITIGKDGVGVATGRAEKINQIMEQVHVPHYVGDLNAMHDAEKILTPEQCDKYELLLGCFALRTDGPEKRQFHKTAAQRAEAFLKTLGKWKEASLTPHDNNQ